MATYLLKWDPNKWDWRNIKELAEAVKGGIPVTKPWSCGNARRIAAGDRVFLIRLGREPRGIVGSGHVTRGSYEAHNLEAQDTGRDKKGNMFIDVRFDALGEPMHEALLPRGKLNDGMLKSFLWDIQTSGAQIPDNVAEELEKTWHDRAFPEAAAKAKEDEERKIKEQEEATQRELEAQEHKEREARERAEQERSEEKARLAREKAEREKAEQDKRQQEKENREAEAQRAEEKAEEGAQTRAANQKVKREPEADRASGPWTMKETLAVVSDYFAMLHAEITGALYSKADHRNRLSKELGRDDNEVEEYYSGISAILGGIGMPFIDSYKPQVKEDSQLEAAIQAFVEKNPDKIESLWISDDVARTSIPVELDDSKAFWVAPPGGIGATDYAQVKWSPSVQLEVDFRKREARNYNVAVAGERFVLAFERARLREAGRKDLVENVEWTSQNRGTDLGYDIKSFEEDGKERYISVKTTHYGQRFPFAVSVDEIYYSARNAKQYYLYRVFNFSKGARLFMLQGSLEETCQLRPVVYRAIL